MPPRVLVKGPVQPGDTVTLSQEDSHHILHVFRLSEGEEVWIIAPGEGIYQGILKRTGHFGATAEVKKKILGLKQEPQLELIVVMPFIKGERTAWAVQKLTEIGVTEIRFTLFKRSVVRPSSLDNKLKRLNRIAMEAVKQSLRVRIPHIEFFDNLEVSTKGLRGVLLDPHSQTALNSTLKGFAGMNKVGLCVGPEGGLEEEEVSFLEKGGWVPARFGPRILRVETAAIAGSAVILNELGDLGCC